MPVDVASPVNPGHVLLEQGVTEEAVVQFDKVLEAETKQLSTLQ